MTTYTVKEFDHRSRNYKTFRVTAKDISECRKIIIQKYYRKEHQYEIWNGNRFVGTLVPYGRNAYAYWMVYTEDSGDDSKDLWINPVNGRSKR